MTPVQLDQQMKDFLKLVDTQLANIADENFEMLDVSGFVEAHTNIVIALGLENEFWPNEKVHWED